MSVARKILSNTLAQIFGKVATALLGLAVVKIATGYLSVDGYGEYVLIYEFLAFFGIAADLGLYTIAVKEMSADESRIPKIIGNILSLRTILVILTMIAAVSAAFLIPKYADSRVPLGVAIAAATVIITIINGTLTSVLQTKLQMGRAALATIVGKIISVGAMVYIVFFGFPTDSVTGFYMLIAAGILGNFAMLITTHYYVRKVTPVSYQFDIQLWKDVLWKSLPYGIALILNQIYFRIDTVLISFMRDQTEVGVYGVAMRLLEQLVVLPLFFMNAVLPVLTKAVQEKSDRYLKIIDYSFDFLAAMAIPMVVGGALLAYPIIFIVSTPEFLSRISEGFYGSDIAFQILVFALAFQFVGMLFNFILISINKQSRLLYINAFAVLVNIVTNLIFIPQYGFRAAAATSVVSEFIILVASFLTARHYLKFKINPINLIKIIFSALVMGGAIHFLQPISYEYIQNWNVLPLVFFGAIIYIAMLFVTRTIDREMLRAILSPKS